MSVVYARASSPDQATPATTPAATIAPFGPAASPAAAPNVYACPGVSPPAAETPLIPNADAAGVYARVSFTSPLANYGDALAAVVNLLLRLANPCRDRAAAHGTPSPWQPPAHTRWWSPPRGS